MPLAEALALGRRRLHFQPHDGQADAAALRELAVHCERFSPVVGIEEGDAAESLFLDVTGLQPLFGSEEQLARQIVQELAQRRWEPRAAVGDTVGAAWAAAHFLAAPAVPVVLPAGEPAVLFDLPIAGLRLSDATVELFHRLGVRQIGQVAQLPRASLKARFGPEVLRRMDQLTGRRPEPLTSQQPLPEFKVRWDFEFPVASGEVIEQVLSHLLERTAAAVRRQEQGIVELACRLELEDAPPLQWHLSLCRPTGSAGHLLELVRLQGERRSVARPVSGIAVEATATAPLAWKQGDLFSANGRRNARELAVLIDRLRSRLGREAVVRPRFQPDAVPERACVYVAPAESGGTARCTPVRFSPSERPLFLLPVPVPLHVLAVAPDGPPARFVYRRTPHDITRFWGPERIETAWWRGPSVQRDYYRVETTAGSRFWLFRRLQDASWFLHGEFD